MSSPNPTTGVLWPAYQQNKVLITKDIGKTKDFTINFSPIPNITSYNIYGSLSPSTRRLITTVNGTPPFTLKVPISNVILADELIFHFWVSYVQNGTEVFIDDTPATVHNSINNQKVLYDKLSPTPENCNSPLGYARATLPYEMFEFTLNEIRRRHVNMIEIGGEQFILYQRRLEGTVCPRCSNNPKTMGNITKVGPGQTLPFDPTVVTEQNSSRYQGLSTCDICFGTGILAGYYYPIHLKLSYQTMPALTIKMQDRGLEFERKPDAWSLWTPIIKQHDILHRVLTGERFVVATSKISTWQGLILRIVLGLNSIPVNDIRIHVTKEKILQNLVSYGETETFIEVPEWL